MPFDEKHRAQQFLIKAQAKYGDLYDYSQVEYVNKTTHVKIGCSKHGAFYSSPKNFLATVKKIGCPYCSRKKRFQYELKDNTPAKETKGCETDHFNVRGGTKKYPHLLLKVFD